MAEPRPDRPDSATFSVGAAVNRVWGSGGSLTISTGRIELKPSRAVRWFSTRHLVVHTAAHVVMLRPRGRPWESLLLRGSEGDRAVATFTRRVARRIEAALVVAGFDVEKRRTWFDVGGTFMRSGR